MLSRKFSWFLSFLALISLGSVAHAQKALKNTDIGVDGFAQFTSSTSGNGITDTTSKSAGGGASLRHSFRWYLGYEAGYQYTRYTEHYSGQPFGVQHNMHDFYGSWYAHGPRVAGIQPFAAAGISALVFSPSLNGGQNAAWQGKPGINFGAGINYPLLTSHFGLRLQYRGVAYKAPDFDQPRYQTSGFRLTSEPMAGLYIRF